MPEPAKDTAIEITPKPRASSVPIPRIVAEINRVASRVRDRNKKEEEDIDDADVLENDEPAPSPKPADIQIIRENTHPDKDKPQGRFAQISSRMIPLLVPIINCVFLARIDARASTLGVDARLGILSSPPPPPPPYSPPPPTVITPSSIASIEHKAVVWDETGLNSQGQIYYGGIRNFKTAAENEGVSTTDMEVCTTATTGAWATGLSCSRQDDSKNPFLSHIRFHKCTRLWFVYL